MTDVVNDQRTSRAARRRPTINIGRKHEVVKRQRAGGVPQRDQSGAPSRRGLRRRILLDADHRQSAAFGGQRISRPGGGFLLHKQLVARSLPFLPRYDSRMAHAVLTFVGQCGLHFVWWKISFVLSETTTSVTDHERKGSMPSICGSWKRARASCCPKWPMTTMRAAPTTRSPLRENRAWNSRSSPSDVFTLFCLIVDWAHLTETPFRR